MQFRPFCSAISPKLVGKFAQIALHYIINGKRKGVKRQRWKGGMMMDKEEKHDVLL